MSDTASHEGFALRHEIFVLDAHLQQALSMDHHESITQNLVQKLLDVLGMERLGEMQVYPAVDMRAPGWSFIQPITTSHISGHYFEKPGRAPNIRMDVYSCEAVEWKDIIRTMHEQLGLADWRATFLEREIEAGVARSIVDVTGHEDVVSSQTSLVAHNKEQAIDAAKSGHLQAATV